MCRVCVVTRRRMRLYTVVTASRFALVTSRTHPRLSWNKKSIAETETTPVSEDVVFFFFFGSRDRRRLNRVIGLGLLCYIGF